MDTDLSLKYSILMSPELPTVEQRESYFEVILYNKVITTYKFCFREDELYEFY